jgi:hypothetical protein
LCLDTLQQDEKDTIKLGVFACQSGGSSAQFFSLANNGALRRELTCASVQVNDGEEQGSVVMPQCESTPDKWTYDHDVSTNDTVIFTCWHLDKATETWEIRAVSLGWRCQERRKCATSCLRLKQIDSKMAVREMTGYLFLNLLRLLSRELLINFYFHCFVHALRGQLPQTICSE